MLEFDKSFFQKEERCGFVIEPMMKNVWAAQLEVLVKVDRICKENGIRYFADWGTLLGAVRHKGFIPWDDDMDICMLRPDYMRFIEVIKSYTDELSWYGIYNMEDWGMNASRVVNFTGFRIERDTLKEYHGCPYGVGIDIFPIDYVPRDKELEEEQKMVIKLIADADALKTMIEQNALSKDITKIIVQYKDTLAAIENICQMKFSTENPSQQELMILMDEVQGLYGEADADYVTAMHRLVNGQEYYVKKEDYEEIIMCPYENVSIPIPIGYDNILKLKYGNYMEMVNVGGGHNYPFYNKILVELSEKNGHKTLDETNTYVEDVCRKYYVAYLNRISLPRLTFENSYFEKNTELHQIQAAQLEALEEIRRICENHNIKFWAMEETFQGAKQNQGFLPKEESLTLGMTKNDYLKFLAIIQKELDAWFDYRSMHTHAGYDEESICIITDAFLCDDEEYKKRFHGCEYSVAVRILPVQENLEESCFCIQDVPFENTMIPILIEQSPLLTISILISNRPDTVCKCLDSVQPLLKAVPSELILTDTGCGTEVRAIIERYTDHIIDFTWCQDFSAARNVGLKEAKGQWLMYLDDDEWFENTDEIIEFFKSGECDKYNVACYVQRNYYDWNGNDFSDHTVDRIIRINKQLHFEHRVHEAYTGIDIGEKKLLHDYVHHYGYIYKSKEEMYKKYERNQVLLEIECKECPNNMRMWHQFIMNQYALGYWDKGIEIAKEAIIHKSESEYWDVCHTDLLYCLEQKKDWQAIVKYGKEFIRKRLFPYESFGVLQYMEKAYYKLGELDKVKSIGNEAICLYNEYKENSKIFYENQLMRTEFVSERAISDMYAYYNMAINKETGLRDINADAKEKRNVQAEYYNGETRNGFYIEPMMKCAWAAHVEVLKKIDNICKEHNIKYFADWGTLLGAVRHKGYIPWDDDLDICMLRPDLERFLEIMYGQQTDLICLNMYTDPEWGMHATKIVNTTKYETNRKVLKEYNGFPFMAGVDIFPIDYVPRDKTLEKKQMDAVRLANELAHLIKEMEEYELNSKEYKTGAKILKDMIPQLRRRSEKIISQKDIKLLDNITYQNLIILVDKLEGAYTDKDCDYVTAMHRLASGQDYYIPKDGYADSILAPFEDMLIPVPVGYDDILIKKYGKDYMIPNNVGGGHDYPFYGRLIDVISKNRGEKNRKTTQKHIEKMSVDYYVNFLKKTATPRIQYRKDFFTSENINGYVVSEERKRIWAALTEVLEEVKKLCSEHNIKLFAIGETVHEAICFHNYAPQSEDLHIAIFREDCARFVSVIQEELSPWFDYRVIYTSENHEDMRAYIITDGYMCNENEYAKRFHGCPHIVGVDISIIDTVEPNEEIDTMRKTLIEGLIKTAQNVGSVPPYTQNELSIVEEWQKVTQIKIDTESNLRRELLKAADQIAGSYRGDGEYIRISADLQDGNNTILPKRYFAGTVEVEFGNTMIPIPIGYGEKG